MQRCKNSNKQLIKCEVLCCSYDKNLWLKCKGCFCFILYFKMVFIQVFLLQLAETSITTWLLCLNFCNTDTDAVPLVHYIQTSLHDRSHENTKFWFCSALRVCVKALLLLLRIGEHPPHLFMPLAVTMAITAQLLMTSAFPFFLTQ